MKMLWKGAPALVLFGAIAMAAAPTSCVQAEAPLFIKGAAVRTCEDVASNEPDLLGGQMDVRYSCEYNVELVLGNQLVARGDPLKLQVETSRIVMRSFDVEVLDAAGEPLNTGTGAGAFTIPAVGFIDAGTGSQPGVGVSATTLIDGGTAQYLAQYLTDNPQQGEMLVIARVVAHGRTLGGDDITSGPWEFPISVCNGCLCSTPADDTCENASSAPEAECFIPQDQPFDCRFIGVDCSTPGFCGVF